MTDLVPFGEIFEIAPREVVGTSDYPVMWMLDQPHDREYEVTGMPSDRGIGYADYVLWGNDRKPLAVVEPKKSTVDPKTGQQQAKLYADCLEQMHGQRPVIFYTNGYKHFVWDDSTYPPREVSGFYKKDELTSLIHRRKNREPIDVKQIKDEISNRYYQKRAIGSIGAQFVSGKRQALLVMATGTGKTRTSISLVDVLQRAGWVKRALFLADRVSLVNQSKTKTRIWPFLLICCERVELLSGVRKVPEMDAEGGLAKGLSSILYAEVSAMNPENFIVRTKLESVRRFQTRKKWDRLSDDDVIDLQNNVAGLPSELKNDDIESRMFDLTSLHMQLAMLQGEKPTYEENRKRVLKIASALEEKTAIPAVREQLSYLAAMQESAFWEGMNLNLLEEMRLRLRDLVPFLDKKERKIIYTDFKDTITGSGIMEPIEMPNMTSEQYRRRVESYLTDHLDQQVIQRLRNHESVTQTELAGLEKKLIEIGEVDGEDLLAGMLERSESPSLAHLVLRMVGLERKAAQKAFSEFLNDESLTANQIRFVEMIIDQLTSRGTIEPAALYESPFISLHSGGPDELFGNKTKVVNAIFDALKNVEPRVSQ